MNSLPTTRHPRTRTLPGCLRPAIALVTLAAILIAATPARAKASPAPSRVASGGGEPVSQTFPAVADAMVASNLPAINYGGGDTLSVGYYSGDGASIYRSLARFDLGALPPDAVIISADLKLFADDGTVSKQILARRLTASWSEGSVTWNNQPASEAPVASRLVSHETGVYAWNVRQTVQNWVSGAQPNHGFLLRAVDETENGYREFRSREAPQGIPNVPNVRLEVTWMPPAGQADPGPNPPAAYLPLTPKSPPGGPAPIQPSPCPELPVWALLRGMDEAYYQQTAVDYGAAGFRPVSVTVEGEGDEARFNAIWVQDGLYGDNWSLQHDLTSEELQAEYEALGELGFRPTLVDAYGQGFNTRFAAAWVLDDTPTAMMHAQPLDAFVDTLVYSDTLKGWTLAPAAEGWRPLWVSVNGEPGDPRYSAIFVQDERIGVLDFDKTFEELKDLNGKRTASGFRLLHLSGYQVEPDPIDPDDDGVRYAGSWVKDPDVCGHVKWQVLERQEDLGLDLEALNAGGFRSKTLANSTLVLSTNDLGTGFRRARFELSGPEGVTLSDLTRIDEAIPGAVFEDGDIILLQPEVGQIITVDEDQDGNIDLMAADGGTDGGQKFVMRAYNYILALEYDAGTETWVELQRAGLPHERYWPISVDEFSTADGRRYNSVWVQSSPDRASQISYAPGDDPTFFQTLDDVMQGYLQQRDIPGGALAVTKDGQLVMARGYTWEPNGTAAVLSDSPFRLASIVKPLTSAAVVRLMEAAGISLDTPIQLLIGGEWYDPWFSYVTVRQLLYHIGGWDRDISFDPMVDQDSAVCAYHELPLPVTTQMIIDYMKDIPLDHEPGTVYSYSNFGYALLGRLIEVLTGQTYNDYMRNQFYIPQGMLDTWPARAYETEAYWREVRYYTPRNWITRDKNDGTAVNEDLVCEPGEAAQVMQPYGGYNIDVMDSHGGWVSSAIDLNRFLVAVHDGSLLDNSQFAATYQRPQGSAPQVLFWDGAALSDETIPALTPVVTWSGITAAAQELYIGRGQATFNSIKVRLSQPGAGYSLVVEYWNGSSFTPLTEDENDLVDGTENFQLDGEITFTPPDDWRASSAAGHAAGHTRYWLRLRTDSAATTAAEFDLLEPEYDYKSFYGLGWTVYEYEHRVTFQQGFGTFFVGDWIAGTTSGTVARIKDIFLYTPPGVTPAAGYLILEEMKGGPFWVDELIVGQLSGEALTDGPGVPETYDASHEGILDGTRTFFYRRSDGVTWAALFNMRVGDESIPLYLPAGSPVGAINATIDNLTALDWPPYDLFP